MKLSLISDIHVRSQDDERYDLLLKFLSKKETLEADVIVFLGDIFDQLIGPHIEYLSEYSEFFVELRTMLKTKKVWWFEGNHDFHFEKFIRRHVSKDYQESFEYIKKEKTFILDSKKIYMSHGDELDVENTSYMKYRKFIRGSFSKFIIERVLSFESLCKLKEKFSKKSKEMQEGFNREESQGKYLRYVDKLKEEFDLIFLGHSHILEELDYYKNVGFPPVDNKFISINQNISYIDIN